MDLLLNWFLTLQDPLISDIDILTIESKKDYRIEGDVFETLNYLLEFVRLIEKSQRKVVVEKLAGFLTSHRYNLEFSGPKPNMPIISKVELVVADTKKAGLVVAEQGMKAGMIVAEQGKKAGLAVAEQGGKLFNTLKRLYSLSAKDLKDTKDTKFASVGKTESVIKVVDVPVQEPPQEQVTDYEPPSLDKIVEFITNMIDTTAFSNIRSISVESGKSISPLPDFITPQEFMSKNPLGTTDNLTLLLKTNSPGIPDILSYKEQAMLYVDPLQKFIVSKGGGLSSSNPDLHATEGEGHHLRVSTVPARIDAEVSASTSPKPKPEIY
jgi:hypothetical protein